MTPKQKRNAAVKRQQELVNAAKAEQRDMTVVEQKEFDTLQTEIESLKKEVEETPTPPKFDGVDETAARTAGTEAEYQRQSEIRSMCADLGVDPEAFIKGKKSVEATHADIIDHLRKNKAPISAHGRGEVVNSEEDKFRSAVCDALIMRSGIDVHAPSDGAESFRGASLRDIALESLRRDGESVSNFISNDELFSQISRQFYNPTSSFPSIMDQTVRKSYEEGHKTAGVTFDKFTKKGTLSDFKTTKGNYLLGMPGELLEVPENGELKHTTIKDERLPSRQLKTYGRQFTISRQTFINDDIGMITRIPAKFAASARQTINRQVYQILINNPAIFDGIPLFGAEHKNLLSSGSGMSREGLQSMIMAMANQTNQFGETIIVNPKYLVVPTGMDFDAFALFNSQTIQTTDNTQSANPFYNSKLEIISDSTINALAGSSNIIPWFMFAGQADSDSIQVDYLNGKEIPTIRRSEVPGTLGMVWDIFLDWGISVMDFRGIVKNPGIKINAPIPIV